MAQPPEDGMDDSSIKPVSSLRSHFESMLNAKKTPNSSATGTRNHSPSTLDRNARPDEPKSRFEGRISLDIPRETSSSAELTRNAPQNQTSKASTAPLSIPPRPRPVSMFNGPPASPFHDPEDDEVRPKPVEPPRPVRSTPSPGPANSRIGPNSTRPVTPQANGPRHVRIPSRSTTPGIEGKQIPFLTPTTSTAVSEDPQKNSPLARASSPKPQTPQPAGAPPPINRDNKPKMTKPAAMTVELPPNNLLTPGGKPNSAIDRISPFNTPPSDDEGNPIQGSYHPRKSSLKPRPALYPPKQPTKDSYFSSRPPPASTDWTAKSESSTLASSNTAPRSRKELRDEASGDESYFGERPGLPLRKDSLPTIGRPPPPQPPVRRSMESVTRPSTFGSDPKPKIGAIFKRNQSNPPSQIDNSSEVSLQQKPRGSNEIRRGPSPLSRSYADDSDDSLETPGKSGPTLTDFPDSSQANRRAPRFKHRPYEIHTKYDTKLFAVCGEYVCTSGYVTRVWNVLTGENILTLTHGDTTKVTGLSFRPATAVENEGKRIWLGTNTSEIHELDIASQSIVYTKSSAHNKREIIKIYRYASEMWSLDEDGRILIWPADESGSPSLRMHPSSFSLPKGHTFSIVAGNRLWMATGKEIRVYQRSGPNFQQVTQRPLVQPGLGEVTAGAILPSQPDRLYFGHIDGKVTIYNRKDFQCLEIISVSLYKISCMVGVGDYLWAGYNTGMVYVYDTASTPWKVKKDWHAHENPIAGIVVDRTSIWKLDRLQVVSLGTDNYIKFWDGMLREDWLEAKMQDRDEEFCTHREVSVLVMTWNAGASKPTYLRKEDQHTILFGDLLQSHDPPEFLVFGFQELVDLEDKKVTAKSLFKSHKKKDASDQEHMSRQYRAWRDYLSRTIGEFMPSSEKYELLHTANLVGLFTCIFVKSRERPNIWGVNAAEVKLGMGGLHGNKGALVLRLVLDHSSICFINCHLAAGQTQTAHRNNDIAAIMEARELPLPANRSDSAKAEIFTTTREDRVPMTEIFVGGGDGSMILDHEICILNGDLNYRIDGMKRDAVIDAVETGNLTKLLDRDQLLLSRKRNPGSRLRAFKESQITFAPTYKYDVGTNRYDTSDKKRSPAWCDRLLYRGIGRIKQVEYRRHEIRASDHRPVSGVFKMLVKTIDPKKHALAKEKFDWEFEEVKKRIAMDIKLDYLINVFGLSSKEAQRLLSK